MVIWKKVLIGLGVLLGVAGIIGCIFSIISYTKQIEKLRETKDSEIQSLKAELTLYGDTAPVYVLNQDVVSGQSFSMDKVTVEELPCSVVGTEFITDDADLENALFKINLEAGTPLVYSVITHELIAHDSRYYDVVAHSFPVTMRVGDYVDMHLVTAYGQDYLVLPKKRVQMVNANSIQLILGAEELHKYNSALVDTAIHAGSALYFTTYVEPAHQKEAQAYYAVSQDVLNAMALDPNMPTIAELEILSKRRERFETDLSLHQDQSRNSAAIAGRDDQLQKLLADIEEYRAKIADGIIDPDTGHEIDNPVTDETKEQGPNNEQEINNNDPNAIAEE